MGRVKVLVLGHRGFIGGNLISFLKNDNSLETLLFEGNIFDEVQIDQYFRSKKPEIVVHLIGTFRGSFSNLLEKNVASIEIIARLSGKYSVKKIVLSSSGAVYGETGDVPVNEESTLSPNTQYGLSKKFAEEVLLHNAFINHFSYVILRFPNIFNGNEGHGVIAQFFKAVKMNQDLIINGNGSARRDFLHVDDACNAILKSLTYEKSNIFNISSNMNYSIKQIASMFHKMYGSSIFYSEELNTTQNISLDFSKARKLLNFTNSVNKIDLRR